MLNSRDGRRFAMVCPNYHPVTCGVGDYTMRLGRELTARGMSVALFTHAPAEPHPECPSIEVYGAAGDTPLGRVQVLRDAIRAFDPTDLVIQYTARMLLASRFGSPAIPWLLNQMDPRVRRTIVFHELYFPWSWRPDLAIADLLQRLQFCATIGASEQIFVTTLSRQTRVQHLLTQAGRKIEVGMLFVGANADPLYESRQSTSGTRRLGVFSMLRPSRRFDLLIDAFGLINAQYPDTELVFIGDLGTGEDPLFRQLTTQIANSPVRKHITLTGPLGLSEVSKEIASLDVYMLPDEAGVSTRSSTVPIAFGSGVPVVGTQGPETDEHLFVSGRNIVYAEAMSAEALAKAALAVLRDTGLADTVGRGGRDLYESQLSWPSIADRFLKA